MTDARPPRPESARRFLWVWYGGLMAVSVVVIAASLTRLNRVVTLQDGVLTVYNRVAARSNDMELAVQAMLANARGYLVSGRAEYLAPLMKSEKDFRRAVKEIRPLMRSARELELRATIVKEEARLRDRLLKQVAIRRAGGTRERAETVMAHEEEAARRTVGVALARLAAVEERLLGDDVRRLADVDARFTYAVGVLAVAGLVGGLVFGGWRTRRLAKLYRELDRLNRIKGEFLAIASHDLRSPLTTIVGVGAMLEAGDLGELTAEGRESVAMFRGEADRMRRLIETYLDLTRLEEGTLVPARERVDLGRLTRDHVARLHGLSSARNVSVRISAPADPVEVTGDPDRLTQVVDNLMTNALKFSPIGGAVRVELSSSGNTARLLVSDDGPGLTTEELGRLFERFSRGVPGRRNSGGLGLGLAISREIVLLHGGTLRATSPGRGRGTQFSVELPLRQDGGAGRDTSSARPG